MMVHVPHLVRDWVSVGDEVSRGTGKVIVGEVEGGEGFDPRSRYVEIRKEMGYPLDRFNYGEAGLRRAIPPAIVKLIDDHWTAFDVHEEIESFDKRKPSVSWDIQAEGD